MNDPFPSLSVAQLHAAVTEAGRAPSVHNVQPARWRFSPDGRVTLLRELGRELPVGDPTGHDLAASLGAAWEGLCIALSRLGMGLGAPEPVQEPARDGVQPVMRAVLVPVDAIDPLAAQVLARRSFRGRFAPVTPDARARLRDVAAADAVVLDAPRDLATVATLHDRATWHFEQDAAYHTELWSWLRLSRRHPRWDVDGLNADCLALSAAERAGARVALRPPVFALLTRLGIARHLVSEAPQVRSAAGLVVFAPDSALTPFDVGRRFYRLWLELTAAGLFAAPMSATSDFMETRAELARLAGIGPGRRVANVLRVGEATEVAESPRLAETLLHS